MFCFRLLYTHIAYVLKKNKWTKNKRGQLVKMGDYMLLILYYDDIILMYTKQMTN